MIFVDANVVLEVIEKRPHANTCEQLLRSTEEKAISLLTLDLVMYFVEKDKIAWEPVKTFLEGFVWLPITDADAQWAFSNFKGDDFEDALQVSCAKREGCNKFATLDKGLAKKYADTTIVITLLS
jgi:predicted nucleic acid-binding protein